MELPSRIRKHHQTYIKQQECGWCKCIESVDEGQQTNLRVLPDQSEGMGLLSPVLVVHVGVGRRIECWQNQARVLPPSNHQHHGLGTSYQVSNGFP
jgi:hypothetical protein